MAAARRSCYRPSRPSVKRGRKGEKGLAFPSDHAAIISPPVSPACQTTACAAHQFSVALRHVPYYHRSAISTGSQLHLMASAPSFSPSRMARPDPHAAEMEGAEAELVAHTKERIHAPLQDDGPGTPAGAVSDPATPAARERLMLKAVEAYASALKTTHEAWSDSLRQAKPYRDPNQIASEALELALAELKSDLPSGSAEPATTEETVSLEAAMTFIRTHTLAE